MKSKEETIFENISKQHPGKYVLIVYPVEYKGSKSNYAVLVFETYKEANKYMMENFRDAKSLDELYVTIYKDGEFVDENT